MKNFVVAMGLSIAIVASGCSDSTSVATSIEVVTEMSSSIIKKAFNKEESSIQAKGAVADSLRISQVRILVSRLKLHRSNEDDVSGDKDVKAGPFVLTVDSVGIRSVAGSTIQDGTYDKLKFEIHKFSSSEISTYLNNPLFADFVTGDRYSTIIDGTVYKNGVATAFSFKSDASSNLSLNLNTPLSISNGAVGTVFLQLQPVLTFKSGSEILDPRDERNKSDIENAFKSAIKALKK